MMTLTKEQNQFLAEQASKVLKQYENGLGVREIMANIYAENLPEKTFRQGEIMADMVLENVKRFDTSYKEAQEDVEHFIDVFQDKVDEGKTCRERCEFWLHFGTAVTEATIAMNGAGDKVNEDSKKMPRQQVSIENVSEDLADELRIKAKDAILNSGIMLSALLEQADKLDRFSSAEEASDLLIDLGATEFEYRAVVAMLAYVNIKNGQFEVPEEIKEMTIGQITTLVCAEIEQARIMKAVNDGKMAVDFASNTLLILGVVVVGIFMVEAAFGLPITLFSMIGVLLGFTAFLMLETAILSTFFAVEHSRDKDSHKIIEKAVIGIHAIISDYRRIFQFVEDTITLNREEKDEKKMQESVTNFV